MNTATADSGVLSLEDRFKLDEIARELDDPFVPAERMHKMIDEVTVIASRYQCDWRMAED